MAGDLGTTVRIDADSSAFQQGIDADIAALKAMGQAIDVTNRGAVNAWREEVAAQKENMAAIGATTAQMQALAAATRQTEAAINSAGEGMGRALNQVGHGLFMVAGQADTMGRGLVTAFSGAAMYMGGPWLTAVGVAALALTRFFDKADEGWKVFEEDMKRVSSEIAKMGPADQMNRAELLNAQVMANQAQQDTLRLQNAMAGGMHPLESIQDYFRLKELTKEQSVYQSEIFKIVHDQIPERQQLMTAEAYHTALLERQKDVTEALAALDKSRSVEQTTAASQRLQAAQSQLALLQKDIGRQFPASGMTVEEGQRFGQEFSAFGEQMAGRQQAESDELQATKLTAKWKSVYAKAALDVGQYMKANPAPSVLETLMSGISEEGPPGATAAGTSSTRAQANADRLGQVLITAYRKMQQGIKAEKLPASKLGTPGFDDAFTVPPDALTHWSKLHELMRSIAAEEQKVVDGMQRMGSATQQWVGAVNASLGGVISTLSQAGKVNSKELMRAAIEPIEAKLQGLALEAAGFAISDAAQGNFAGAAKEAAAAVALTALAHEASSLMAGGGGGGGGAGGGGGGGGAIGQGVGGSSGGGPGGGTSVHGAALGSQGISGLGASRAQAQAMSVELIVTQKGLDNRTLSQQRTMLQRLDDRQTPVRFNLG